MNRNEIAQGPNSEFLKDLISGNISDCYSAFVKLFEDIATNLQESRNNLSVENFNFSNYEKMSRILFYLKGSKIQAFPK